MGYNLPPGVSESDLPGNGPEDELFDLFLDSDDYPENGNDAEIEAAFKKWKEQRKSDAEIPEWEDLDIDFPTF